MIYLLYVCVYPISGQAGLQSFSKIFEIFLKCSEIYSRFAMKLFSPSTLYFCRESQKQWTWKTIFGLSTDNSEITKGPSTETNMCKIIVMFYEFY